MDGYWYSGINGVGKNDLSATENMYDVHVS